MKFYIVNYKETELNEERGIDVNCGTCDEGFTDIRKAIELMKKLAREKICEFIDLGYDAEDINITSEECEMYDFDNDESSEYICVGCDLNTYEYSIYGIDVD